MEEREHYQISKIHKFQKEKVQILSNGKVVGDPGEWDIFRDLRNKKGNLPIPVENKFEALAI